MHDRTRRLLCRLGFVLFCVVPTLAVATWAGVVRSATYRAARQAAWERWLSEQLGMTVTLTGVDTPSRGVTTLEGLTLADAETGQRLATARQVEVGYHNGELLVQAAQPECDGAHWRRVFEAFQERLLRGRVSHWLRARLLAGTVSVRHADGQGASAWADMDCRLAPSAAGPTVTLEFRDAAAPAAAPVQLRLTRNRQVSPPATRWELHTQATPLPCTLLADQVPLLGHLGPDATFEGDVTIVPAADGWDGELAGRFRGLDLDRVVTDHFDHKLCGTAEVILRRAAFRGGKLRDAAGDLVCDGGVVSWSLLDQAERSLGLIATERVFQNSREPLWPYRQLRFGFELSQAGLKLSGRCAGGGEGVVMADQHGPLLRDKPEAVVQVVALVKTLASKPGHDLPTSFEAYRLLHVLPVPTHDTTPSLATGPPLYSPLRLKK